jgi:hypothetical protein
VAIAVKPIQQEDTGFRKAYKLYEFPPRIMYRRGKYGEFGADVFRPNR